MKFQQLLTSCTNEELGLDEHGNRDDD